MRIGELSARTGATVRMLRYYEEHGLLAPRRKESGYRSFTEDDILRVRYIRCMLASALPTRIVGQVLRFLLDEPPTVPELPEERARLAEVLETELSGLDERIAVLNQSRDQLARFLNDVRSGVVGPDQRDTAAGTDGGVAAEPPSTRGRLRSAQPPR
jgi:DNA-binding transcriptional MerR regulator